MPSPPFAPDYTHTPWLLDPVSAHIEALTLCEPCGTSTRSILVLRDDLLHPWANGNKLRKFDGYLPALMARGVTDILTCGGVQSAHCAALSCLGAERGVRVHVLLRGEAPAQTTGNLAVTIMYAASVTYVARDHYADRAHMFREAKSKLEATLSPHAHLEVIPEGGRDPLATRGYIRLIKELAAKLPAPDAQWELIMDAGTGVSTAGVIAGIMTHKRPWRVRSVMLMKGAQRTYQDECEAMLTALHPERDPDEPLPLVWEERVPARRFGAFKPGDLVRCQQIARATGVMFDPIYTLASYESACAQPSQQDARTLLIHTGGALNLFGALSRYPRALT
jgi:D-cysteine desulfhydrase